MNDYTQYHENQNRITDLESLLELKDNQVSLLKKKVQIEQHLRYAAENTLTEHINKNNSKTDMLLRLVASDKIILTVREIADITFISVKSVYQRRSRIRKEAKA